MSPAVGLAFSRIASRQVSRHRVTGDFNGDGELDLAVANGGYDTVSILLGNGDGTFQPAVNYRRRRQSPMRSWQGLQRRRQARPGRR